jgi:hypothetical protein
MRTRLITNVRVSQPGAHQALDNLAAFFGSKELKKVLTPGKWRDRWLNSKNWKLHAEPQWYRPVGHKRGDKAKSGKQPSVDPCHGDAIAALRGSIPHPPPVRTPELMKEYRRLMNMRKAIRRILRAG